MTGYGPDEGGLPGIEELTQPPRDQGELLGDLQRQLGLDDQRIDGRPSIGRPDVSALAEEIGL